jgi:sugar O-acyltransferase (sialic acid O-acetyltransferase NeuD family)
MKNLIIVGAGGFGREIYNMATQCDGYNSDFIVKGFLDDNVNALAKFNDYPAVLSSLDNYELCSDDIFSCAIGNVDVKKKIVQKILHKKGEFISLIHPSVSISKTVEMGIGCIIFQNASIGCDSQIGDHVLIQNSAVVGHDVKIGDYSRLDSFVVTVGGCIVENEVTIHTSAVINKRIRVKKRATVGALSFVVRNVKEQSTVYGNPAMVLKTGE